MDVRNVMSVYAEPTAASAVFAQRLPDDERVCDVIKLLK